MKEVFRNSEKMCILFEDDAGYVLSVLCGGVGMYEVKVRLNFDEMARYQAEGQEFLEALAYDIATKSDKYKEGAEP